MAERSLRQRFGRWIAGSTADDAHAAKMALVAYASGSEVAERASTQPIAFHPPMAPNFGAGVGGQQPPHSVLLRESLGFADLATRAIANRVSTIEPLVKVRKRRVAGTERWEILDDHPMKRLLDRPHPNLSGSQLLRLTAQYIVTVGEAYYLKVGSGLGVPVELHPIPPTMINPLLRQGVVVGYGIQDGNGAQTVLPPDVIVRFYFPDPEAPWQSEGYLGPSGIYADSLKFSGQHYRRHFQRDATPKTVLEAQEGAVAFTPDDRKVFFELWDQMYNGRDGTHVGAPFITPTGYKLIQLLLQNGKDIVPLLEFWANQQLMAFGVPKSVLGMVVSGDRSSAETNQYVFDMHTVLPIVQLIQDGLTAQLAPDFDAKLFVEFEDFVSDDKEFELKREAQDIEHGVRVINRVLEDRDDDTVEWGDEPLIANNLRVFRPSAEVQEPPSDGGGEDTPPADAADEEERLARQAHAAVRRLARRRRAAS